MIAPVLVWLAQDMSQVLGMGFLLVPEIFLLLLLFRSTIATAHGQDVTQHIWGVFLGGLIWDFRWTGLPGLSAVLNTIALLLVVWLWRRTPPAGRTGRWFVILTILAHFFVGVAHYFTWKIPSDTALRLFLIQQLLMFPVLAVFYLLFLWKMQDAHV